MRAEIRVNAALLETLTAIAGAAGRALLDLYGTASLPVERKQAGEPVTEADRRTNRLIVERLREAFSGVPVVAEESEPLAPETLRHAARVFFVDPLDGTREFIRRNGEFAVMIGLVDGARAVAGVVHAPALGATWTGAAGLGAWRTEDAAGARTPVRVSATEALARARVVASRSHRGTALRRALAALGAREVRALGSAGLKGARVAEGLADAYVDVSGRTKRWDACAIDALVTAAGGRVTDLTGAPLDYRGPTLANERGLVVSNGRVHAEILARLAGQAPRAPRGRPP